MKLKLLIVCTLLSSICFAQLSVSNTNYLYVNDIIVYVEDDVSLKNTNSYLYLRNGAQLIQGSGTTGNSGVGKLSTYQNGTVHNYAYNYWCSPVGNIDIDDTANRAFRPNNNIYDVTTAPITSSLATYTTGYDGSSSPLVISSRWLYTFNAGGTYPEWDHISSIGTATAGYGFIMKGTSGSVNNQLYDFRGKPNNGTMTTGVLAPIASVAQWTLVGNPYPSALDARDYIHDTQNQTYITGTLYYWEQDLSVNSHYVADYVGGYGTYTINSAGTTETWVNATFDTYNQDGTFNSTGSSSVSGKRAYRYIPIGQGFMVEGTVNGNARVNNRMRNFIKKSAINSEFFSPNGIGNNETISNNTRTSNTGDFVIQYNDLGFSIVPETSKRFRLNIDINDLYTRQLVQTFDDTATQGHDYGLDCKSPEGVASDTYWIVNDLPYIANALSYDINTKIPLAIKLEENMAIRFRIFDIQNFDESQPIYIHDIENEIYVDLQQQNYNINLESGDYSSRFEITFNKEALTITEEELTDFKILQNNSLEQLTILNPNSLDIQSVSLIDVSGKQIFNQQDLVNNTKHTFSTNNLSEGVYIATVTLKNKQAITQKVIISH